MAPSPCGLSFMVWPTMLALFWRSPLSRPILYMVYSSLRCEGLKPSISGNARDVGAHGIRHVVGFERLRDGLRRDLQCRPMTLSALTCFFLFGVLVFFFATISS